MCILNNTNTMAQHRISVFIFVVILSLTQAVQEANKHSTKNGKPLKAHPELLMNPGNIRVHQNRASSLCLHRWCSGLWGSELLGCARKCYGDRRRKRRSLRHEAEEQLTDAWGRGGTLDGGKAADDMEADAQKKWVDNTNYGYHWGGEVGKKTHENNQLWAKRWIDNSNFGKRWIDDTMVGKRTSETADKKWVDSTHFDDKKWIDNSNFGKRWVDSSNFGKRWVDSSNFGKRWVDSSNFGKRWVDSSNFGKRWVDSSNFGKRWIDNSNFGKRWIDSSNFAKKWVDSSNFGKRWVDSSNFGKRWIDSVNFYKKSQKDDGKGDSKESARSKKWVDSSNFGKRWIDDSNFGKRWIDNSNFGKRSGEMSKKWVDDTHFSKKWIDDSNFGKRGIDDSHFRKKWSDGKSVERFVEEEEASKAHGGEEEESPAESSKWLRSTEYSEEGNSDGAQKRWVDAINFEGRSGGGGKHSGSQKVSKKWVDEMNYGKRWRMASPLSSYEERLLQINDEENGPEMGKRWIDSLGFQDDQEPTKSRNTLHIIKRSMPSGETKHQDQQQHPTTLDRCLKSCDVKHKMKDAKDIAENSCLSECMISSKQSKQ